MKQDDVLQFYGSEGSQRTKQDEDKAKRQRASTRACRPAGKCQPIAKPLLQLLVAGLADISSIRSIGSRAR